MNGMNIKVLGFARVQEKCGIYPELDAPTSGTQVATKQQSLTNSPLVADSVGSQIGNSVGILFWLINVILTKTSQL